MNKIYNLSDLKIKVINWKLNRNKIVFTNGCFDILHLGHIKLLKKAKKLGHKLIVGINADNSPYFTTKGSNRPILDEKTRSSIIASLYFVDAVILFSSSTPLQIIQEILPDVLVKGKDYNIEDVVGATEVIINGGRVVTIDIVAGNSTTKIIEKIIKNNI